MSAVLCGKRSFFEDPNTTPSPVLKKVRFCSSATSPVRFSLSPPPAPKSSSFSQLKEIFPLMDNQLLERVLEECGDDIDYAVKRLHELCLTSSEGDPSSKEGSAANPGLGNFAAEGDVAPAPTDSTSQSSLPKNGPEWVELLLREMNIATSQDDARIRARKVFEDLEKSISARSRAAADENVQKENIMLKGHIEQLMRDNTNLKRLVAIQHKRQKEMDDVNRELQHLRELVPQYQEQLRIEKVNNYALSMHLKQAQESSSMPGRFHPDVF